MSFYALVEGQITYKDKSSFEDALNLLRTGHWLNEKNQWLEEVGSVLQEESTIDEEVLSIYIPRYWWRNLAWTLDVEKLLKGSTHEVAWATTDGQYQGGVVTDTDGVEKLYDLEKWAREPEQIEELGEEEPDPNDPDFYNEVCSLFIDTFI